MRSSKGIKWVVLPSDYYEINLDKLLCCGQSFTWIKNESGDWMNVLSGIVWSLKQDPKGNILYKVHTDNVADIHQSLANKDSLKISGKVSRRKNLSRMQKSVTSKTNTSEINYEAILKDYFQLHVPLKELYDHWSKSDSNFCKVASKFSGIRILRQDPVENLFSFICSSNNNIPRITSMVQKLCEKYGRHLLFLNGQSFYTFPTVESLAKTQVEEELRSLGFGYRAKFINQAAQYIVKTHHLGWLESLRRLSYEEAHASLIQIPGVGAKVADCVCLMSLDKPQAIPVDTHVWQLTCRDYLPHLKTKKSLTDKVYKEVGDFFRKRFGDYAGWANSVLFSADLRKFKEDNKN